MRFNGQGILHLLCYRKDNTFLEEVMNLNPNVVNDEGTVPIQIAVREHWENGVNILLTYGAHVNITQSKCPQREMESPILIAIKHKDNNIFHALMKHSPDLSVTDCMENSVLHLAATSSSHEILKTLLQNTTVAAHINCANAFSQSPMHSLALQLNGLLDVAEIVDCAQLLIKHGIYVNLKDTDGQTALYLSVAKNHFGFTKLLLDCGANPNILTGQNRSVLHAACAAGGYEILTFLITSCNLTDFIFLEDVDGLRPFHCAVGSRSTRCCEILLKNGENLANRGSTDQTLCEHFIDNMPNAITFINTLLNSHITMTNEENDPNLMLTFDYHVLSNNPNSSFENTIVKDLNFKETDVLLRHPIVESFIFIKWRYIKYVFYMNSLVHALFLALHSYFITVTYTGLHDKKEMIFGLYVIEILLLFVLFFIFILHLLANVAKYYKQYETYFKGVALLSAAVILFSLEIPIMPSGHERMLAAFSIFFNWLEFMLLIGRTPHFGLPVFMFSKVSISLLKFIFAFVSLILAFSFAFAVLLNKYNAFETVPSSITKTLMMMVGEIDYSQLYMHLKNEAWMSKSFNVVIHIFLICFVLLIPILLINLIIAIAVNDLSTLQTHGKIRRLVKQAAFIQSFERVVNFFLSKRAMGWVNLFTRWTTVPNELTIRPNAKIITRYPHIQSNFPNHIITEAISVCMDVKSGVNKDHLFHGYGEEIKLQLMTEALLKSVHNIDKKLDNITDKLTALT